MLAAKLTLLFGAKTPLDDDLDDDEIRQLLRESLRTDLDDLEITFRQVIARQILDENPPLVWETAQRLVSLGIDRESVLSQLVIAFEPIVAAAFDAEDGEVDEDVEDYETRLLGLPIPPVADIRAAVHAVLTTEEPVSMDDFDTALPKALGIPKPARVVMDAIDSVVEDMLANDEIALLDDDTVIVPALLTMGITLTTRLSDEWPPLDTDFVGLSFLPDAIGEPPAGAAVGQLVVARHQQGGIVVEASADIPVSRAEIKEIRQIWEAETRESGLPVTFADVLLHFLFDEPTYFDEPRAPLTAMVLAAGFEIRGKFLAADESFWRRDRHVRSVFRIHDRAAGAQQGDDVMTVFKVFARVSEGERAVATAELRRVLDLMADFGVLLRVADEFFDHGDDPAAIEDTADFARRLTAAASRPLQRAVAAYLMALVAERRGDPLAAADALVDALHHAPEFLPTIDRLAWTRSDQGRADEAKALWRQLGIADNPDLRALESVAAPNPAAAGMRRNEPCWCGSGRKFKVCHLRANDLPALPDRFTWVLQKPVAYLSRRGEPVNDVIDETAWKLADGDPDMVDGVHQDPLLMDIVLTELGWHERFLAERGVLLPEDEQLLYASWLLVPRTLFEVAESRPGKGVTLRDLRAGDVIDVADVMLSRTALKGQVFCARALPDGGDGFQICGGVFSVPPGHEQLLNDILDEPDAEVRADRLLDFRAAGLRPPQLATSEGEPMVRCEKVFSVTNPLQAKKVLSKHYELTTDGSWQELHELEGRRIIRVRLSLVGTVLTVETMSKARMERATSQLKEFLPRAKLISETRTDPLAVDPSAPAPEPPKPIGSEAKAALAAFLDEAEERWCAEPVPALGGLTPREAAADPTRREEVIRLIDSFERMGPGGVSETGAATFRPVRLRELLGLS